MTSISALYVHTVQLRTYLGVQNGQVKLADPVTVACYVQETAEVVENTTSGREVTSTTIIDAPITAAPSVTSPQPGQFTPESEVVLASGRLARVARAARHEAGALNLGLDHVQVWLA